MATLGQGSATIVRRENKYKPAAAPAMPNSALTDPVALRRFSRQLVLGNLLVLSLLAVTAGLSLLSSHRFHTERAMAAAENLVRVLAVSIASEIKQIDNALASAVLEARRAATAGDLSPEVAARIAAEQRSLIPQVDTLRLTDRAGLVLNDDGGSGSDGDSRVSLSDRDYFKAAAGAPTRLIISEPLQGRIIKKWGVMLARARIDDNGAFDGIAYSGLTTEHFLALFDDVQVGAHGAVTLCSGQLRVVARYAPGMPAGPIAPGGDTPSPELRHALAENPQHGAYITQATVDGVERVSAYQRVPGHALLVIVGLGTQDAYAPWRLQALQIACLCLLLEAVVVSLSLLIYRQQRRQIQTMRELAQLSNEQHALLDNDLVSMARFKHRVISWHNRAMAALFGYGPNEMRGKPSRMFYLDDADYEEVGLAYARLARGERFRKQLRMLRSDGRAIWIDLSGVRLNDNESLWMMVDITAVKDSESQAHHIARHDGLTGLRNRSQLPQTLADALASARRAGCDVSVCFIDLDGFKAVNDAHGHGAGDTLLREAAKRMSEGVRSEDALIRMGGDEFVIVLCNLHSAAELEQVTQRLLTSLARPYWLDGNVQVVISASIGVATAMHEDEDIASLVARADQAMYTAKREGKNRVYLSP